MKKIILDLCGGTGAWSFPYKEHSDVYDVRNITLPDYDILETQFADDYIHFRGEKETMVIGKDIYGILAAPPCTMFSFARTKANKLKDLEEGMQVVRACLNIIWKCMEVKQETKKKTLSLKFWALENPNGLLKHFLGKPVFEFDPWEFGDNYQKKTHLWGWFNEPKKKPIKLPKRLKELHKTNSQPLPVLKPYKSLNPTLQKKFDQSVSREIAPEVFEKLTRQERRAITPAGFAKAFFEANK